MFNPKTTANFDALWDKLGTFYTLVEPESKKIIQDYWEALFNGLEGLHYDLAQAHLVPYLEHSRGYLEDAFQDRTVIFEGSEKNCESTYYMSPIGSGYSTSPVISGASYEYKVSSVYNYGSSIASPSFFVGSADTISGLTSNPIQLEWPSVSGVSHYNIYGRSPGLKPALLHTTSATSWVDSGIVSQPPEADYKEEHPIWPVKEHAAVKNFIYTLTDTEQYLTVPVLSGINTEQTLLENVDYEVNATTRLKFLNPIHKTFLKVWEGREDASHTSYQTGSSTKFIIQGQQAPDLQLVRGIKYTFDCRELSETFTIYSGVADPINTVLADSSDNLFSFIPDNTTPSTIYYGSTSLSGMGDSITVVDSLTDTIHIDDSQVLLYNGADFLIPRAYKILPTITNIYLKGLGAKDPKEVINSEMYPPFLSGWSTEEISYEDRRKLYGDHLKNWCYAMSAISNQPPALHNLENLYSLTKGFPFSYHPCIVESLTVSGGLSYLNTLGDEGFADICYAIDSQMSLNYGVGDHIDKFSILVSGINFYDNEKSPETVSSILGREGETYEFDVYPKWITATTLELHPYPSDSSHFIRPNTLSSSLVDEALSNVTTEASVYIPPAEDI